MSFQRKTPKLSSIISDSFLRSYSISRIVRINQENRNKAKVTIMRKIRTLKEEGRKKYIFDASSADPTKIDFSNIKTLKQQLTMIDQPDTTLMRIRKDKKTCKQCEQAKTKKDKQTLMRKQKNANSQTTLNHRRFNSDSVELSFQNNRQRIPSPQNLKSQLKRNDIIFTKNSRNGKNLERKSQQIEYEQNSNSLSSTLSSFNRLRLMTNAKSSQKIMQHFYKRSLENCTLEDLKFLIKMQKNKKQEDEKKQQIYLVPMRFGKKNDLFRKTCVQQEENFSPIKQKKQRKTVWKNQVLQKNCPLSQNTQITNLDSKKCLRIDENNQSNKKLEKISKLSKGDRINKENQQNNSLMGNVDSKQAQLQVNFVYCYKDKRFPINDNKLNIIYDNWQKQYLKKKKIQQLKLRCHTHQIRQLRAKSIKLKDMLSEDNASDCDQKSIKVQNSETSAKCSSNQNSSRDFAYDSQNKTVQNLII